VENKKLRNVVSVSGINLTERWTRYTVSTTIHQVFFHLAPMDPIHPKPLKRLFFLAVFISQDSGKELAS
jgi:hypothetical protein